MAGSNRSAQNAADLAMPPPMTMAPGQFAGVVSPGNIDLAARPVVQNPDGTYSTVLSTSFGTDKGEVLVPRVSPAGRILSEQQAQDLYRKTGQNLGVFDSPADADTYAEALHRQQARMYAPPARTR